jgi:hypothetical protein
LALKRHWPWHKATGKWIREREDRDAGWRNDDNGRGRGASNLGGPAGATISETNSISEENEMATKGKVLVLVSSGYGLPLKHGKIYTGAGYYLNELTVPVRALMGGRL